jgi:hypothetical protein
MSNATIIGSASEFNGVTTFKSQPIITSAILANTDSSTNIATTAWSNAFWTYVKTQANTFSGITTFSNTTNINTTGSATTTIGNILSTTNISGSAINMSGSVNINTIGTTTTTIGNIQSTTNVSGNVINMSGAVNINTGGTATTTIGNSNSAVILNGGATINGTITPGYSYPFASSPNPISNQIGARGVMGGGGNQLYIIGDGNWRSYASYNNVPLGIYSIQVWMTPGPSAYQPWTVSTPLESALYIRTDPFYVLPSTATTTPSNVVEEPTVIQYLYNPLHNFKELATGAIHAGEGPLVSQTVATIIVYVDKPSVALCLRATTSPNTSLCYTEMVLTRIA